MRYTIGDKYGIIKLFGGESMYSYFKIKIFHLELKLHTKQKFKEVVYRKKLDF